jgi:hypothetical protein
MPPIKIGARGTRGQSVPLNDYFSLTAILALSKTRRFINISGNAIMIIDRCCINEYELSEWHY